MLTRDEAGRIAAAMQAARPEWSPAQWLGVLGDDRIRLARGYGETFHAALAITLDPDTRQPTRLLEGGPWWRSNPVASNVVEFRRPNPTTDCAACSRPHDRHPYPGCDDYLSPAEHYRAVRAKHHTPEEDA